MGRMTRGLAIFAEGEQATLSGPILLSIGFVAAFFGSVGSDGFGMVLLPSIGQQALIVRRSCKSWSKTSFK